MPGIVFVLSIDKEQLCYAIKGVYGSENFDAKEYLTRFIDLEYTIPKPNDEEVIRYYFEYYGIHDFYRQEKRRLGDLQYEFKDLVNSMRFLILSKSPSLRDLEKIISHLKIYVSTFGEKQFTFPEIAVVIILLKRFNVSLLQKIAGKDIKPHELVKKLEEEYRILPGNEEEQKRYLSFVFGTFLYTYCQYLGDVHSPRELVRIENSRYNLSLTTNYDQSTFEAYFTNRINNMNINDIGLDWIMKRIDLTEKLRNSSTQ
ncbi:P-loop NTPase fold protein [Maribacter litopenaei]|uniref:P-loop NTPase fold protein n=1 Tax=Maribacter litopenaei TaxID=2976127 RepID=A0ABY5Y869_9FLAO|nr:P-loop NTPase fold protein [Maribacter litopenaei]UWX54894.1 P-loop NTPase fold protein [Maribacter litopenaei]